MNIFVFRLIFILIISAGWTMAQSVPPPPTPIAESDLRDNTIKMRSVELERLKRDAHKISPREPAPNKEIRFSKIKKDFEEIQKLQDSIVNAYTAEKNINYLKISRSAADIRKHSVRLDENLFESSMDNATENKHQEKIEGKSVRDLIVELDNSIGEFVINPIFKSNKLVGSNDLQEAQIDLSRIIKLSNLLSLEAEKIR